MKEILKQAIKDYEEGIRAMSRISFWRLLGLSTYRIYCKKIVEGEIYKGLCHYFKARHRIGNEKLEEIGVSTRNYMWNPPHFYSDNRSFIKKVLVYRRDWLKDKLKEYE